MKHGLVLVCILAATASAAPSGALDFDLSERGSSYVLRDDAFEITFPGKPEVSAQDTPANGMTLKTASGMYATGNDVYGFFLIPVPKNVPYDVKKGMTGARDGALKNVGGKIVSEEDLPMGGLKARHTVGTTTIQNTKLVLDIYIAWDEPHHTLVGAFTATSQAAATQADKDFIASFKSNPKGKAPPSK